MILNIDCADLCRLRRISTLKYAIACKVCRSDNGSVQEISDAIKSADIPVAELNSFFVNVRINSGRSFLKSNDWGKLIQLLREIVPEGQFCPPRF